MWKHKAQVDSSRALKELGLGQFIPLRQVNSGARARSNTPDG